LAHCILESVAYHAHFEFAACCRSDQKTRGLHKGVGAVKVICVYYSEGRRDSPARRPDSVRCSPGLGPVGGNRKSGRHVIAVLVNKNSFNAVAEAAHNVVAKLCLYVAADNADYLAEACADSIENRILEDNFAGGTDGFNLFD